MKLVRYRRNGDVCYGILEEHDGETVVKELSGTPYEGIALSGLVHDFKEVRLLSPVEAPRIFGLGYNYVSQLKKIGREVPSFPMLFMKPHTTVIGPEEPIIYPRQAREVQFEGEVVAVIGRHARHVSEKDALEYVFGYTCGNDVSERIIQREEMKIGTLLMGKAFDTFCPLGPCVATGLDPAKLTLTTRLNGEVKQQVVTSDLVFSVAGIVSYMSSILTLVPGDAILTGTPTGVAPMTPGDVVEVEVSGVGVLRNHVLAE